MKISILSYDLSHNCLGRAHVLAKALQRLYDVEIIGPMFGEGIWHPVANDFDYVSVPGNEHSFIFSSARKMLKAIDGDIIYAVKPKPTSYGIGLLKKLSHKLPLVLDIDDWEVGFNLQSKSQFVKAFFLSMGSINGLPYTCLMEKLTFLADDITVSSTFLQSKFGGVIVPHGRNTEVFDPQKFDGQFFRKKYGFDNEKLVMFFGTPRPHKGVEEIIQAVQKIKREDLKVVIVGATDDNYSRKLKNLGANNIRIFGMQSFSKIPEFLSMADMVVLPQHSTPSTFGQVPAKIFDAMAMAKPIIATTVSDLPKILDNCGLVVEPGNLKSLSEKILWVLDNKEEAQRLGNKARERCIQEYSWNAMEKTLDKIFRKY
jgi:glycosyltransferase involved in cell wall biosynthesis